VLTPDLIGRELQRRQLAEGLAAPHVRLIVLRGAAGAGKTALAREAMARAQARGALVGAAAQQEGEVGGPASALAPVFRGLLDGALEQLHDPEAGLASLRAALGPSAAILGTLDPTFARQGSDASGPLTSEAAAERLGLAATRLLAWLRGLGAPIVILLDDWGRASRVAQDVYARLVQDPAIDGLTILATERPEEPSTLRAQLAIDLAPLSAAELHGLAAARLDGDAVTAAGVVDLLGREPLMPLALLQTISALIEAGALARDEFGWRLLKAEAAAVIGETATETLVRQVARASPQLRPVLEALAVHGGRARRAGLAAVAALDQPALAAALDRLAAEGFLETDAERIFLAHDTVRATVLRVLEPRRRIAVAASWADHLGVQPDLAGPELETALRLRLDAGLRAAPQSALWAQRFLAGAAAARAVGEADRAARFADAGMALEAQAGQASFAAARESARAALQQGDLAAVPQFAALMAARAEGEDEGLEAAEIQVFAARLSGDQAGAFAVGCDAVRRVGLALPERPTALTALAALARLRFTADRPGEGARSAVAFRLLNTVGAIGFERNPMIAVVLAARTAIHGPLRGSAFSAALRTMLACMTGDWAAARRWGEVAYSRLDRDEPLRAPAMQLALQFGRGLHIDAAQQMAETDRLRALALEEGDLGVAAYANRDRALASMRMPVTLDAHRKVLEQCKIDAGRFQDQATTPLIEALDQVAINLAEAGGGEPWRLSGAVFDSPRFSRTSGPELERVAMACMTFEASLANAFGAWETTFEVWRRMAGRLDRMKHHPVTGTWAFHVGLARARLGLPVRPWERAVVARSARFNPSYAHRALALEAEAALARGRIPSAMRLYESAIAAAEASGFGVEHGTVATAAGAAARAAGRGDMVERFAAAAETAWRRTGAWRLAGPDAVAPETRAARATEPPDSGLGQAAAERANRAKTRLLAGAAHELRTPMQGIQGLLDLAADDPGALDLERLREAVSGLGAVVDDLTEFSALEAERFGLVDAPFDPVRLAETELDLARPEAGRRGRGLRLEVSGASCARQGDAGRIAQILRNLLANALRYGDGETVLTLQQEPARVTFAVEDGGPGLSAADQTRLFQPFIRGDASGRAEGSGLGLALSRRLAERMGGTLVGDNRADGGASFRLSLPLEPADSAPAPEASPLRVLLAEDVDLSRETLAALLRRQGHTVTAVGDGVAAIAAGQTQVFEALVLDVRMPGADGPDVLAALRRAGVAAPALMLSAAVDEPLARRLVGLEPVRLVRKPLTAGRLNELLALAGRDLDRLGLDAVLRDETSEVREAAAVTLRGQAQTVEAALARGDVAAAEASAHAAAGLAGQFGFPVAEAAFAAMEAAATGENPAAMEAARADLRAWAQASPG